MTEPMVESAVDLHAACTTARRTSTSSRHLKRWAIVSSVIIVLGLLSLWQRGLNLGIDFEGGVVWEVPGRRRVGRRGPGRPGRQRARRAHGPDAHGRRRGAAPGRGRAARRRRGRSRTVTAGAGRAHRLRHRGREPHRGRPVVGRGDQPQGAPRPRGVPGPHHDLHHAAVRAPHGHPHPRRAHPRRAHHDRRVLDRRASR